MYTDANGEVKGDGRCCYLKVSELAEHALYRLHYSVNLVVHTSVDNIIYSCLVYTNCLYTNKRENIFLSLETLFRLLAVK